MSPAPPSGSGPMVLRARPFAALGEAGGESAFGIVGFGVSRRIGDGSPSARGPCRRGHEAEDTTRPRAAASPFAHVGYVIRPRRPSTASGRDP